MSNLDSSYSAERSPLAVLLSKRAFLKAASLAGAGLASGAWPMALAKEAKPSLKVADLPKGAAPAPVLTPHFPSRLHAFVWRNWPLVSPLRMARVVGAKESDIVRLGRAMGLGNPPRITSDQQQRSYLSVIKRNWHLLPYDQLLDLLGWTPDQLEFTLREDDFLFVKLGNLKPKCEPLKYLPPDEATLARERAMAGLMREEFPDWTTAPGEPLFNFVAELSRPPAREDAARAPFTNSLRFCYSYFAVFGDPALDGHADPYPDGLLERLAQSGVTGVWLHVLLRQFAPFPWEDGAKDRHKERLNYLKQLVARARRHGIRVFLYLNEPRSMPLRFFKDHPELKGVVEGEHAALCTTVAEVQRFMVDSVATICRAVPDLGGFFSITASENLTSCWSHGGGAKCPRCAHRKPADVIASVLRLYRDGIREAGSSATLIAWDWGWDDAWAGDVIRQLPDEAALMSVSEWSLPIERGGVKAEVGEYSISAVGPGPRATRHWKLARERGLKTIGKIQAGSTWELSAVPYIPAVQNVAQHAQNLRAAGIDGLMLGWTLGGYPSPNLEVVSESLVSASAEEAMSRVAERRFGRQLAPAVVRAWSEFSRAFREFPYHIGVVYSGPLQLGPANPLWALPTGYKASMVGFPYDDLDAWRAVYPTTVFASQLEKVADGFDEAAAGLEAAAVGITRLAPAHRAAFEGELRVARAAAVHFRSGANQARFVLARRSLAVAENQEQFSGHLAVLRQVLQDEITLAKRLAQIQRADSRMGFEASNHYFYVPVDLAEKVLNCRDLLENWLPGVEQAGLGGK